MNKSEFVYNGEMVESSWEQAGDTIKVTVGEKTFELQPFGDHHYLAQFNGKKRKVAVVRNKDTYYIDIDSVLLEVREPSEEGVAGAAGDQAAEKDKVFAPMPGKIVKIMVAVGDDVTEKQHLLIVEAMKMENPVLAKANGKVKAVNFEEGDQVDTETPLIELELNEE